MSSRWSFLVGASKEAHDRQEAKRLIEAGFEYVVDKDGVSLFRKLK